MNFSDGSSFERPKYIHVIQSDLENSASRNRLIVKMISVLEDIMIENKFRIRSEEFLSEAVLGRVIKQCNLNDLVFLIKDAMKASKRFKLDGEFILYEPTSIGETTVKKISMNEATKDYRKFYTPDHVADLLVAIADPGFREIVLEPSAGNGQIVKAISKHGGANIIDVVEKNVAEGGALSSLVGVGNIFMRDFLLIPDNEFKTGYNKIIANPPFGREDNWVEHIYKMWSLLLPAGKIVSIIPEERIGVSFRDHLIFCQWTRIIGSKFISIPNWSKNSDGSETKIGILIMGK